ncbi:hypothetical protein [Desulfobulbus alkaliphilus]|uniref:hypothetical protein n=1 Tax=Desulfobulbus alkaliphilus TaxID=869814 RepID=UPI001962CB4A|nr:hypothetical protein [Desulfobulbus alkaliphilus]MBM9536201.1 hypothetical protein [Desulfobulbus alkaliphilus]
MKKQGRQQRVWSSWLRGVLAIPVLVALFVGLAITGLPMLGTLQAAESIEEAAAAARKLQLEGTRLQLQGDLQGAVQHYRESIALLPNERLESLIEQLEKQVEKAEEVAVDRPAVAGPQPDPQPEPEAAAVSGIEPDTTIALQEQESTEGVPEAVVRERVAMNPEEELIYAFMDWSLSQVSDVTQGLGFMLETDHDYTLNFVDGRYEIRLDPFILYIVDDSGLDFGPLVFHLEPQSADLLMVRMTLPESVAIFDQADIVATLTVGSQNVSGEWDRGLLAFDWAGFNLGNLTIEDSEQQGRLDIEELVLGMALTRDEDGAWEERYQGHMNGLSFVLEDSVDCDINHMGLLYSLSGTDFFRYIELRKKFTAMAGMGEASELAEWKEYFSAIDEFLEIVNTYANALTVEGVKVRVEDMLFAFDTMEASGDMRQEQENGLLVYDSQGLISGVEVAELGDAEYSEAITVAVDQLTFAGQGAMKQFPPDLFANLFNALELAEQEASEEIEMHMAGHVMEFAGTILELIQGSSLEVNVKGVNVLNAMPEPVTVDLAAIGGGFDVGTGEGGTVRTQVAFSGLTGLDQGDGAMPEAARFNLELKNIPSLLALIPESDTLMDGDMGAIEGHLMAQAMGSLMTSNLALAVIDSFIAFPASRIEVDFLSELDTDASFFSTSELNLLISNADDLTRIIKSFGADPEMLQMLTTLVALGDRSEVNGTTVDRIDARINQEGKVFINTKDVTLMFFPE